MIIAHASGDQETTTMTALDFEFDFTETELLSSGHRPAANAERFVDETTGVDSDLWDEETVIETPEGLFDPLGRYASS